MFLTSILLIAAGADPDTQVGTTATTEATYTSNCGLGKGYFVIGQDCGPNPFSDWVDDACDDSNDVAGGFCIETGTADTQQQAKQITVTNTNTMKELLSSMSNVAGTGWGVTLTASAEYVSQSTATSHSVSFYKTSSGDSYDKHIKYTQNLQLNDAAKAMLTSDPDTFVSNYGSFFISKIIYSNYFIASVKVEQTSSDSSSDLGIMASISASDMYNLDASTTFNTAASNSDSTLSITTEAKYNGPTIYDTSSTDADEVVQGILGAFTDWQDNVNAAALDTVDTYAKPTRMVYSRWTELEEVQAMFPDGFPDVLQNDGPSSTLVNYLHQDSIFTAADRNSISNLLAWSCVIKSSSLTASIKDYDDKLMAHQLEIENIDEGVMGTLESSVLDGDTSWFVGVSGEYINAVNDLMLSTDGCQGGQTDFQSDTFTIKPWGKPNWETTNYLAMPSSGEDAFLTGFKFTANKLDLKEIMLYGQTLGYQSITDANQVNGGVEHDTSLGLWHYYEGGKYSNMANVDLKCAKEGTYMTGLHIYFTNVICACSTPNTGTSGHNQRQCTDGSVDWCWSSATCTNTGAVNKDNIDCLCGSAYCNRRLVKSTFEDEMTKGDDELTSTLGNSPAGTAYGRVSSITVHCKAPPVGVYGLPTGSNTNGPYTITNQAGKTVEADCPEGSGVYKIDWTGIARAENDGSSKEDPVWTIAKNIKLHCRQFSDFQTADAESSVSASLRAPSSSQVALKTVQAE